MKGKILVVDDMEINRAVLLEMLRDEYETIEAENGRVALDIIEKQRDELSLVLLDLVMPEIDGLGVLKEMSENGWMEDLPVLVITSEESLDTEQECFDYGVSDFIRKPFSNLRVRLRVGNLVKLYEYRRKMQEREEERLAEKVEALEATLEKTIASLPNQN